MDKHIMMAGVTPKQVLIKILKESIEAYECSKTDEDFDDLCGICGLILGKKLIEDKGGIDKLNELYEIHKRTKNLLIPDNN